MAYMQAGAALLLVVGSVLVCWHLIDDVRRGGW